MRKIVVLLLLARVFLVVANSQNDYIQYYQLINKSKKYNENNQNDSALIFLKEAFSLVDYVHVSNLNYGKKIAKKQKDRELLNFCKNSIDKSKGTINVELKKQLYGLEKEDQRVRGRKYSKAKRYYGKCLYDTAFKYTEKKKAASKKLMEEWWRVDSTNVECVKTMIAKYGFPSEKMVGTKANIIAGLILLHYDRDTANHIMGEKLAEALKDGSISPDTYGWIIDRHLMNAGKLQYYYSIPTPWIKMTEERRKVYNENRHSIGMKSLDEIKIIERKNSVVVKSKK